MPVIRMRQYISGSCDGKPWPLAGETIEVSEAVAVQHVEAGLASWEDDSPYPVQADDEEVAHVELESTDADTAADSDGAAGTEEGDRSAEGDEALKPKARKVSKRARKAAVK